MKILVGIARFIIGVFFIFSGFVKLVDPVGFSYKLEEYFGAGVLNIEFLIPFALIIAIFVVIFELLLGVMLILGFAPKFTIWSLLLMIIFFTFLTFYSAYTGKVTDCGCFGSAIPMTPWQSFWKDVVLLILILFLFFNQKYLTPLFRPVSSHKWVVTVVGIGCLALTYHVLMHLPIIDFRAYKVGTNIPEGMTRPEGAPEAIYDYNWRFKIDGEEKIITTQGSYPQVDGDFIDVETKLVKEGYVPPIHDFIITKDGEDFTESLLSEENLLMITAYDLSKSEREGWIETKKAIDTARENGYKVIVLSAAGPELVEKTKNEIGLDVPFYVMDETTIKTIVRSNPGLVVLHDGTIVQKVHWNDVEKLKF
ncbi:MAG TPA: BT_3928 family protein [Flavobacteriaceae bacterium]|nr:BT_3928 family protein [Flavobacteriaceae bacterium]